MSRGDKGLSALSKHIASELAGEISSGGLPAGAHLSAQQLADRFGVSRSPVREALTMLAGQGLLEKRENRGFFVTERPADQSAGGVPAVALPFDEPNDYQRVADDWLANRLPVEVTEQMLRDRYRLTRAQLADILLRAGREGWIERKQGYGWRFLPVAKTREAFEQIYRFRIVIEPAAILEPNFRPDPEVLSRLRQSHEAMLESGIERLSGEQLLDFGAQFHEQIVAFSNNPFFLQSLVRVNRMRRLMEYRARVDRRRLYTQWAEHIEIMDLLSKGDIVAASYLLRGHLSGALEQKAQTILEVEMTRTGSNSNL